MICADARECMLEAARAELEVALGQAGGDGGGGQTAQIPDALEKHLRACPECREVASLIVSEERILARALEEVAPRTPLLEALKLIDLQAGRRGPRWRSWGGAAALAAAAVVGILAVSSVQVRDEWPGDDPGTSDARPGTPRPEATSLPAVEAPEGTSVAVFETDNPEIIVFWFYEGRGQ
jgi:hypothetical protein